MFDSHTKKYHIIVHTSQGRDVYYLTDGVSHGDGYDYYTPQKTDQVLHLRQQQAAPNRFELQLLTGETIIYNSSGQVSEIWDTFGPTPNKVLVTWDSTSNGNVSTVTDAQGNRRLSFTYSSSLLTSVAYQMKISGTWTTEHTTSYTYTTSVTKDATQGWYVPANSTEWTTLLAGTGLSNPSSLWLMQEASGNLADSIGTAPMTASGTGISYQQSSTGWARKAVTIADSGGHFTFAIPSPATTSILYLFYAAILSAPPSGTRTAFEYPDIFAEVNTSGKWQGDANTVVSGTASPGTSVHAVTVLFNRAASENSVITDQEVITPGFYNLASSGSGSIGNLSNLYPSANIAVLYGSMWTGSSAEMTDTQVQDVIRRLTGGSGNLLTSVTIGGQLAQSYYYYNGALSQITDGGGANIATFAYDSATAGKVVRVDTARGTVGFEYAPSRTGCSTAGQTLLYFNKGNTTSCSVDSDCGTGYMCGGKTGTGANGTCFLAGRCLTTSTVNNESVITNVSAVGPGGGSCSGACTDFMQYVWASPTTGLVKVQALEDPLANYTSMSYNTNGTVSQIFYGATSSTGTSANRTTYLCYDTTFPGRIKEIRRQSDLDTSHTCSSDCAAAPTTGCDRTIYTYNTDRHTLSSIENLGFTMNSDGTVPTSAASLSKIVYSYDFDLALSLQVGRVAEIDKRDSAGSNIAKTVFDFFTSSGSTFNEAMVQDSKVYKDSTNYLQPQILGYDFWGHATSLKAPDGNMTCDTYDSARGFLSSRRKAMNGQTDCSTTNSADLTTSYARDSWLRLTQLTRPDGSCVFYSYDLSGRSYQIKRRDDCTASSPGDTQQYSYTADSQVSELDTYDSSGTLTAKQPYTYFAGRQIQDIVNPADTSKFTGLVYDSAGKLTEVDGAASLSKTVYHFDTSSGPGRDGRVTSDERYKTTSTSDTWTLLYSWMGEQSQVTDGDSKVTGSTRDDASRLVKISSPDLAGATVRVYDAADRLTSIVEDVGGGTNQLTHNFTFDQMGRNLNDDYAGSCPTTGTAHAEIQRTYDALPSGVTCPMTGGCNNLSGRLAYVETVLLCASTYSSTDGSLDQFTFYSYDKAGRLVEEYITDDAGRTADHQYQYTKNGALSQVTMPSGAVLGWTYGSTGSNSDTDLVTAMWRTNTSTPIADTITWNPFGPLLHYNWEAQYSGSLQTNIFRDLAYRITGIQDMQGPGVTYGWNNAETRDAMGRVTARTFITAGGVFTDQYNSYYLYDEQSRVLCETTTFQSTCPTTGGASVLKNNHSISPPFTNAGDWKQVLRQIPGSSGGLTNNFNSSGTYGTSHQLTDVNQSDGTPAFGHTGYGYDAYGNRSYDDNTTTLTNDRRDYLYDYGQNGSGGTGKDARHNVTNVRGQYYTGTAWHYYDVTSAFDHKNRRVFKSFYDETTAKTAQWFFYYDALDRLSEVRYTPDISSSGTYSVFQLSWLGDLMILYWQTDYPSVTTSKRYTLHDETGRIWLMVNWPSSGNVSAVWGINQTAWGFDTLLAGSPNLFQPLLFAGQYQDTETIAYENDGATIHRPGLALNGFRTYDPFTGGYLQIDPLVEQTRTSYVYVNSDPVGDSDPLGLWHKVDGGPMGTWAYPDLSDCDVISGEIEGVEVYQMQCPDPVQDTGSGAGPGSNGGGGGGGGGGTGPTGNPNIDFQILRRLIQSKTHKHHEPGTQSGVATSSVATGNATNLGGCASCPQGVPLGGISCLGDWVICMVPCTRMPVGSPAYYDCVEDCKIKQELCEQGINN